MAHIHLEQGKTNLALIQLFNVLEQEQQLNNINNIISVQLDIAQTYYLLHQYSLSQKYLDLSNTMNAYVRNKALEAKSNLLQTQLYLI